MIEKSKRERAERNRTVQQRNEPTAPEQDDHDLPREKRTLWGPQRQELSRKGENERNNYVRGRGGRGRGRGRNNVQYDPGFQRRELSTYEYRNNRNRNDFDNRNYYSGRNTPDPRNSGQSEQSDFNNQEMWLHKTILIQEVPHHHSHLQHHHPHHHSFQLPHQSYLLLKICLATKVIRVGH